MVSEADGVLKIQILKATGETLAQTVNVGFVGTS